VVGAGGVYEAIARTGPGDVDESKGFALRGLSCSVCRFVVVQPVEEWNVLRSSSVGRKPVAKPATGERIVEVDVVPL
jgi:hypothetical protein